MDGFILTMAVKRMLFGLLNLTGALLMWRSNSLENSLRVNGIIGSIGPLVFLFVSSIGLVGLAGKIPVGKLLLITLGVFFTLLGTR